MYFTVFLLLFKLYKFIAWIQQQSCSLACALDVEWMNVGNRSQDFLASSWTGNCWMFYCTLNNGSRSRSPATVRQRHTTLHTIKRNDSFSFIFFYSFSFAFFSFKNNFILFFILLCGFCWYISGPLCVCINVEVSITQSQ